MMIAAIDKRHLHWCIFQRFGRIHTAKAATDNNDMFLVHDFISLQEFLFIC